MNDVRVPTPSELIEACQGLVRSLAVGIHRKLPPHVELDDLIAYGQLGLVEAAKSFDPSRGIRFSTYAYYRIRGAIYDGLVKMSWFSRTEYQRLRCQQMGNEVLQTDAAEPVTPEECTTDLDLRWLRNLTRALAVVYLTTRKDGDDENGLRESSLMDPSAASGPTAVIQKEVTQRLHELIDALPPEAAALIRATYFEGLTLEKAGERLGVSKSWASRLHAKTLQRLARSLRLQGETP